MAEAEQDFGLVGDEEDFLEPDVEGGDDVQHEEGPFDFLYKFHPETIVDYAETIIPNVPLQVAPPDGATDAKHESPPFLTIYERTKILGTRTNQLAEGARPFITVPEYVTNPLDIAKLELEQRRLPFIVKRPMPDGTFEYWRLSDLMPDLMIR
jgi:DNA-directed RNA polymerase I, II, and III subunit RPABC2